MSYTDHEVFQAHCRFCLKVIQADTYEEVLEAVERHEEKCEKKNK